MQIILLEKVVNLGNLGDLVKVKDGYARNFLIPQGKAKRATPVALKEFEAKRAELEKAAAEKFDAAKALAEKFEGVVVTIARKAGVEIQGFHFSRPLPPLDFASLLWQQREQMEHPNLIQ